MIYEHGMWIILKAENKCFLWSLQHNVFRLFDQKEEIWLVVGLDTVLPEAVWASARWSIDLDGRVGAAAGRLNLALSVRAYVKKLLSFQRFPHLKG
jgi:hypothetical protein